MQFKVPQDVLRADKIVGFLTLRQLIIVTLGGGLAYGFYTILSKQYFVEVWLPPVAFIAIITIAFAFIRFHDIPFEKLILSIVEYKFKPQKRTWQKIKGDVIRSVLESYQTFAPVKAGPTAAVAASDRRKKLEEVTKLVDTHAASITSHHG
ncbi:PrgI family protein [Candidatus Gracilibacteria bacterium]|nr:PrgI family protein [Candidatus Gracilibacteria bacterium]